MTGIFLVVCASAWNSLAPLSVRFLLQSDDRQTGEHSSRCRLSPAQAQSPFHKLLKQQFIFLKSWIAFNVDITPKMGFHKLEAIMT